MSSFILWSGTSVVLPRFIANFAREILTPWWCITVKIVCSCNARSYSDTMVKLKLQAAMNGPSPLCVQFGGSGAVLLCEVPPNCTQRGEGPFIAACSFNLIYFVCIHSACFFSFGLCVHHLSFPFGHIKTGYNILLSFSNGRWRTPTW